MTPTDRLATSRDPFCCSPSGAGASITRRLKMRVGKAPESLTTPEDRSIFAVLSHWHSRMGAANERHTQRLSIRPEPEERPGTARPAICPAQAPKALRRRRP
jgi:hypothetical protein